MRYNLIVLLIAIILINGIVNNDQNVNLNIQSGYVELPPFSEDYISMRNYYFGQILNPGGISGKDFTLKMTIKSNNVAISSRVDRSNYLTLNGEAVKILDVNEIASLFRLDDLIFQGITKEEYLSNGLPDGLYQVCFELIDITFDSDQAVSKGCILQQVRTHNSPEFTVKKNDEELQFGEAKTFQWRPRHITAHPVSYAFSINEYKDNWNYGEALAFDKPILDCVSPSLSQTIQTLELEEYIDAKLVAVVRVLSDNPNIKFKNNGFSQPLVFSVKDIKRSGANLSVNCEQLFSPTLGLAIHIDGGNDQNIIQLNNGTPFYTTNNPYYFFGLTPGQYKVIVEDAISGDLANCKLNLTCQVGASCNDNNTCTSNDVYDENCVCEGVPVDDVSIVSNNISNSEVKLGVNIDCSNSSFEWSNGSTSPTIVIPASTNCMSVDITCGCPDTTTNQLPINFDGTFETSGYHTGNQIQNGDITDSGWQNAIGTPDAWMTPITTSSQNYGDWEGLADGTPESPQGGVFVCAGQWGNTEGFRAKIPTEVGSTYTIKFWQTFAGNVTKTNVGDVSHWNVHFGNTILPSPYVTYQGEGNQIWEEVELNFIAENTLTLLKFHGGVGSNPLITANYVGLDDVRIYKNYTPPVCDSLCVYSLFWGDCDDCIVGLPCDDDDPCTIEDHYDYNCQCNGLISDDANGNGIPDTCDPCPNEGLSCDDLNECTINDVFNSECECEGEPISVEVFAEEGQMDTLCNYCIPIDPEYYGLSSDDFISTQSATVRLPSGDIITLNSNVNFQGFNFPYCYSSSESNCFGYSATISEFASHLNNWISNNNYEGILQEDDSCADGLFMSSSSIDIIKLTGTNSLGDPIIMLPINEVCEYSNTYQLYVESGCDSMSQYVWSTGDETSTITIGSLEGCYTVTITCITDSTNYCQYIGQYGENCEGCIVGQICDDNNPCTSNDQINTDCECIGIPFPDSDNDGVCDQIDVCFGFNDGEDEDGDSVPDGCDLCHGQPDSVLPNNVVELLQDDDPENDPDLSTWNCEEYPCNDNFEIISTIFTFDSCDYCLDLTSLVGQQDDLTHITSVTFLENGIEKTSEYKLESIVDEENFEEGWGIWSGTSDSHRRNTILSNSPEYCIELRDNTSNSRITTSDLDLCSAYKVKIDFTFLTQGFDDVAHDFFVQYKNSNQVFETVKTFTYGQHFINNVRYFESIEIDGPFSTNTQFRIKCDASTDDDLLFIDDIKITSFSSDTYSCEDSLDDDFITSWIDQFTEEVNSEGYANDVSYTDGYSELCESEGNFVTVLNSNIELISVSYYTSNVVGLESFNSVDCGEIGLGDSYTSYTVNIDCPDADIVWSNGMATDSILVPSSGAYSVTVACADGCEYTEDIAGDCMVGSGPCRPSQCYENDGYFDENCNCVGASPIENADPDGDGLCGDDDPCLCDGENIDSDEDGVCDCEECPEILPIHKKVKVNPIYEELCDYKIPIYLAQDQDLMNVVMNGVYLFDEEPFDIKYCYDLDELECETVSDIFDDGYATTPSLKRFMSDFRYYLNSQGYTNFVFKDTLINNNDHLILKNVNVDLLILEFYGTDAVAVEMDCNEIQTAQELYVDDVMYGPDGYACSAQSYLWSNGATTSTIQVPHPSSAGYCLTVTCADGCELETCLEGSCNFGEPCNDYDPCTVNDAIDAYCNCIGVPGTDSDGDGVSNSCDVCPGHDDNADADNDGIPDGCEDCPMDEGPEICNYCAVFPTIKKSKYQFIKSFSITYNGVQVASSLNTLVSGLCVSLTDVDNCPGGNQIDQLVDKINNWISSNGYQGEASFITPQPGKHPCCTKPKFNGNGGNGDSRAPNCKILNIESTDLVFHYFSLEYGTKYAAADFTQGGCTEGEGTPESCDDGDPCTIDDHYDENCNCVGTFLDSDGDMVCDLVDRCPGHPDYLDVDNDGLPDGCDEIEIPCSSTTYLTFCDYLQNRMGCVNENNTLLQFDLREMQEEIKNFFEELNWESEHFNVPELITNLQNELDSDGDSVIDYFDPCPCFFNQSLFATGKLTQAERNQCCGVETQSDCGGSISNIITDGTQAQLLANWMFAVQQDIDEEGNFPACAESLGMDMIETADGWTYNADTCKVKFSVNCGCECDYEILDDLDGDGICNTNDTNYGEECNITCNPSVCEYVVIEDCECIYFDLPDSDGDGVCDLVDDCQPAPGITYAPGTTPPEFDDLLDSDGDGTPNCNDACPTGGWMGLMNSEIPTPTGPGDPCDDGNPCTFADAISADCNCEGILLDFDDDGITDCGDCVIYYDDTSTVEVDYVLVNPNINFINCESCYYVGLDMDDDGVPDLPCDICPLLSDSLDYNNNGVPDCIDPPYMEIGCPDTSAIILGPEGGIMLSFNSEEIEIEDIPNPIGVVISAETHGGADDIHIYDYVTLTFTREIEGGIFEAFYAIPDLDYSGRLEYAGISYANHQGCVIYSDVEVVGVTCPADMTVNPLTNRLELEIVIAATNNADLLNFFGTYSVNLTSTEGGAPIAMTANVTGTDILSNGGDSYSVLLANAPSGTGEFSGYYGSITLPNGVACPYNDGVLDECPNPDIVIGDPCDDNNPCTHHDRYDENCECTGDASPDSDYDGLCDEIDPCPLLPNTAPDNDGDGYPDCPCPPIEMSSDVEVNSGDVIIEMNASSTSGIEEFNFSITGGPDGVILDTTDTEMPITISNLPKGYEYDITITSVGSNGCMSDTTVTVDIPFESDPALCGLELEPFDLTTSNLLIKLNSGEQFVASDFDIHVKKAKGSYGKFTGKGYIKVPYFSQVRVNVTFNNITISADRQMIDGVINVNGYGLAVLGDPLSDDINNVLTDIINVLEEIDDVLDEIIPVLEAIDELVSTTGNLVDEETKNCVINAQTSLDSLRLIAEENQDHPNIVQLIKDKADELQQCIEEYENELAQILEGLSTFIPYAVGLIADDLETCPSNLATLYNTENEKYKPQFDAEKSAIMESWQGTNSGLIRDSTVILVESPAELSFDNAELSSYYFDVILQHDFCNAMQNIDAGFNSNNPEALLSNVKIFASLLIEIGDDSLDEMSLMVKEGKTNSEIYTATKEDLIIGFKNVLLAKAYQSY